MIFFNLFRKNNDLKNALENQRELCREITTDKLLLESELIKRTKQLHDIELALEIKVEERTAQLLNELSRLKEINITKDEFIRIVSHELRTPMDAMRGNIDMILKGETGNISEKTREYLLDVLLASDRLVKIVNDMLQISRIESRKMKYNLQELDIKEIIETIVRNFESIAKNKKIDLHLNVKEKLPKIFADLDKLFQIFDNLLNNALKFTHSGSILISAHQKNDFIIIELKDTGLGFTKEEEPKLFSKFPEIDIGISEKGTGLGLYISKELISKMGGEIWAFSEGRGKGATFSFSIPLASSKKALEIKRLHETKDLYIK